MNRFDKAGKNHPGWLHVLLPVLAFSLLLGLFGYGLQSVSALTESERLRTTKEAVVRAAVHCYASEGMYPQSLSYLEEHYGLTVDTQDFVVDYRCFASNIMPDITVIPRDGE